MSEKKIRSSAGISVHRIELADGQLPDMFNGVNGVAHQTLFRPTHIDVEFDLKGVVETRIYGLGSRRTALWARRSSTTAASEMTDHDPKLVRSTDGTQTVTW